MEILNFSGFFNSATLFSNQLFPNFNWLKQYLNSFASYTRKKNFYFEQCFNSLLPFFDFFALINIPKIPVHKDLLKPEAIRQLSELSLRQELNCVDN